MNYSAILTRYIFVHLFYFRQDQTLILLSRMKFTLTQASQKSPATENAFAVGEWHHSSQFFLFKAPRACGNVLRTYRLSSRLP